MPGCRFDRGHCTFLEPLSASFMVALNFRARTTRHRRPPERRMTDSGHACSLAVRAAHVAAFTAVIHRRSGLSPSWVSAYAERSIRASNLSVVISGQRTTDRSAANSSPQELEGRLICTSCEVHRNDKPKISLFTET